jgi:NAD(P)-dependent dehydrogenase (short-subunit alcohol dehydrogenase family)
LEYIALTRGLLGHYGHIYGATWRVGPAIITGAASGIGAASARPFAREAASVLIADIDEDGGEAVAEEIRAAGGIAIFHGTVVRDGRHNAMRRPGPSTSPARRCSSLRRNRRSSAGQVVAVAGGWLLHTPQETP